MLLPHSREHHAVLNILSKLGFKGCPPLSFFMKTSTGFLFIPYEETISFDRAIRFLGSGTFDPRLSIKNRYNYYMASQQLMAFAESYRRKEAMRNERRK